MNATARMIGVAAGALLFWAGPLCAVEISRARYTMGTLLSVTLTGGSAEALQSAADAALDEVDQWDRRLSTYKPESDISRVNRSAPDEVPVSSRTIEATRAALDWARQTGGAFDPTVGPLMVLWGFRGDRASGSVAGKAADRARKIPGKDELARALPLVNHENVRVTDGGIALAEGMALDFGGIGKGWALDRALEKIQSGGAADSAVLNFGGQILFWSRAPRQWPAAVREPRHAGAVSAGFSVNGNGSLATSAASENFITATDPKGPVKKYPHKYGHIMDPRTGQPAESVESVTVWAPSATDADVLSTALFVMGPEKGMAYAEDRGIAVSMTYIDRSKGRREIKSTQWKFEE